MVRRVGSRPRLHRPEDDATERPRRCGQVRHRTGCLSGIRCHCVPKERPREDGRSLRVACSRVQCKPAVTAQVRSSQEAGGGILNRRNFGRCASSFRASNPYRSLFRPHCRSDRKSRWRDLNPRPNPYEGFALASLSYTGATGTPDNTLVATGSRWCATQQYWIVPITAIRIANQRR